jgi:hypothetical protein
MFRLKNDKIYVNLTVPFGEHRSLRKRVLESSRVKDTIRTINSKCYGPHGEPKDSVDQDR